MKITIGIDGSGVEEAIRRVEQRQKWFEERTQELAMRLASLGATYASLEYSRAVYTGPNDVEVEVKESGKNAYKVIANGEAVLFIEFGSGLIGGGHPEPLGYGPGTYPGKGHWDDPNGWWLPRNKNDGHSQHTFGNPPAAAMYNARKQVVEDLERIAKEVFSH